MMQAVQSSYIGKQLFAEIYLTELSFMALFMQLMGTFSITLLLHFGVLFPCLVICRSKVVVKLPPNVAIPAVIAFGDSIMDTGNNNNLKTLVKCNFPPYGKDFVGGIPTGRFCNGRTPIDFLAEGLGIKEFLPAYLDENLQPSDLVTGVCFASGGAGYDPLTSYLVKVIPLSAQLEMFKEYIRKLIDIVGEEKTNFILANTLFLVVAGSNDLSITYFLAHARPEYDVLAYTDFILNLASNFVKELHEIGARRIGVLSVPPIGCLPFIRTIAGGVQRNCVEKYNNAAILFNLKLSKELDSLNHNLPNSRIVYIDIYNPLLDIILDSKKYGYEVVDKGCCGTGTLEAAVLCNSLKDTCPDASKYVFWDSFHVTERVCNILISQILQKYLSLFF